MRSPRSCADLSAAECHQMSEPENHDAQLYERLLQQFDDLIASGRGDDPEADAIRDQMDGPWTRLTHEEIQAIYKREARRVRNIIP